MKIMVCYIYGENYGELAAITIPTLLKYCAKHDYECDIKRVQPNEKGNYSFIRMKEAIKLLDKCDVLLMLEGDMMITNMNYKVEDFIDSHHDICISADVNGINTASFIFRSTEFTKDLLEWVYSQRDKYGDEQNLFESKTWRNVKVLKHPSINSIPYEFYAPSYGYINWEAMNPPPTQPTLEMGNWENGCFICHTPGKPLEERIKIFNEIKQHIVYE